jgi:4-hydroxybenzoate polyprenyltransferase
MSLSPDTKKGDIRVQIGADAAGLDGWHRRLDAYVRLIRFNRPIGSFLLMWPALWALWLAGSGNPPWEIVLVFIAGVFLMRSAGCAINDFADRDFDGHVARTSARPLAVGEISAREAVGVFVALSLIAFVMTLVMLNRETIMMSFVAVILAMIYPFMKRFTHVPQLFLGAAFGWAVPMAFTAISGSFAIPAYAWVVFAATIVWALIYDTEYAMVDRDDDLEIGIKSTAILFGRWDRAIIGVLQVIMLAMLAWVGQAAGLGWAYYAGLAIAALLAVYQQHLIRDRKPKACFTAFLNNNYFGMAIFVGLVLDFLIR